MLIVVLDNPLGNLSDNPLGNLSDNGVVSSFALGAPCLGLMPFAELRGCLLFHFLSGT